VLFSNLTIYIPLSRGSGVRGEASLLLSGRWGRGHNLTIYVTAT